MAITGQHRPATVRVTKIGLWTLLVMKTNSDVYDISDLPEDHREIVDRYLDRLSQSIATQADLDRLLKTIEEVADGNIVETLERVVMLF